jgi:hypothetical protein
LAHCAKRGFYISTGQIPRSLATKPNFTSTPWRTKPRLFLDIALQLELGHFLPLGRQFRLLRLHLSLARKRMLWIGRLITHPLAQHVLM